MQTVSSASNREIRREGAGAALLPLVMILIALWPSPAEARVANRPWPPIPEGGLSFVHFGEEHVDDPDGPGILAAVVASSARYKPDAVTMSGDKGDDNSVQTFESWKRAMDVYASRGIPFFAAPGNHDRSPPGSNGLGSAVLGGSFANYSQLFADQSYPFGDAPPPSDPRFQPRSRPAGDPDGASSHYAFSLGAVRWIVLDNSCFSFTVCDRFQQPSFSGSPGDAGTYDYLANQAAQADAAGQLAFVSMHMPTQDDRPGHSEPTPAPHTMGEGTAPDNAQFEQAAAAAGIDGVFMGHVKGQWKYEGVGGVPYFTDGGAGGEVYAGSSEQVGVDTGYWHGYRTIFVREGAVTTDNVPVFIPGGIAISGPKRINRGDVVTFAAAGQQPTTQDGTDVKLELRDPDPARPNADNLVTPARIWRTSKPRVLKPVAATADDPRRNPRRQTISGSFKARCPGRVRVQVKSGWETTSYVVRVRRGKGALPRACHARRGR